VRESATPHVAATRAKEAATMHVFISWSGDLSRQLATLACRLAALCRAALCSRITIGQGCHCLDPPARQPGQRRLRPPGSDWRTAWLEYREHRCRIWPRWYRQPQGVCPAGDRTPRGLPRAGCFVRRPRKLDQGSAELGGIGARGIFLGTRSIWRWPTRSCGARAGRSTRTCCGMSRRSVGSTSG
jgi:hypothetical protein